MRAIKKYLILELLHHLILLSYGMTEFRCTNKNSSEPQNVKLQCPPGLVIDVKEALYGKNQWGNCQYLVGDCTELFSVDDQCCGRNDCSLIIRKIYSIKCMAYVTFFRIIYECEKPEKTTCNVENEMNSDTLKNPSLVLSPTSPDHILPTSFSENESKDLYIIIGSAVTVAFLLVGIIAVIFILRKFQCKGALDCKYKSSRVRQREKQCVQELFIVLCKRHPPDGCESPTLQSKTTDSGNLHDIQPVVTIDTKRNPGVYSGLHANSDLSKSNTKTALTEIIQEVVNNSSASESDSIHRVTWADPIGHVSHETCREDRGQNENGSLANHDKMFTDV